MRRAIRVAAKMRKHLAHRAIIRDRVADRLDADKAVCAVFAGNENATIVPFWLKVRLLHIIITVRIVGPNINTGASDRLAVKINHAPLEQARFALAIKADGAAHRQFWRAINVKRPKHGVFRGAAGAAVVDGIDQHRKAKRVRQQDELLPFTRADLPGFGKKIDAVVPFGLCQMHLFGESVQVFYKTGHHQRQARVDIFAHAGVDGFNRSVFGEILGHLDVLRL